MRPEHWVYTIPLRLRSLFRRKQADLELDDELRDHVEQKTEEYVANGLAPKEARRQALLEMGGLEKRKEECRDTRRVSWLQDFVQDVRYGLRILRKSPGFATVVVLTLALGIGANTAIFSAVNGILFEPLSYPHADRLMAIWADSPRRTNPTDISLADFQDIAARKQMFDQAGAAETSDQWLTGYGAPEVPDTQRVTGNFFSVFGVKPLFGRPILPTDVQPGHGQVAVLSYDLWRAHFRGDPRILGKTITMTEVGGKSGPKPYVIVGVMPPGFGFSIFHGRSRMVWIPLVPRPMERTNRLMSDKFAVVRARSGLTVDDVNAQLLSLSTLLAREHPDSNENRIFWAESLRDLVVKNARTGLFVLWAAVSFLLLIACVNISSVGLARGWGRRREVAIRYALGATGVRVVRQFLTESLILALAGGATGVGLAYGGVRLLRVLAPPGTPRVDQVRLDLVALGYALAISVLAGVLFGLVPAIQISNRKLGGTLKEIGGFSLPALVARHPRRLRSALVICEVALCLILVIASALAMRSFEKLTEVPLGFRTDHILTQFVNISPGLCKSEQPCFAFDGVLNRVRGLPGVEGAALSSGTPLSGGMILDEFAIQGQPLPSTEQGTAWAEELEVSPGYFRTMGISLLRGRSFAPGDAAGAALVAIVNEDLARRYFSGHALGKHVSEGSDGHGHILWAEIVGVVNDSRDISPSRSPWAELYFPFDQAHKFPSGSLVVRTVTDPESLAPLIREQVWAVDKNAPVTHVQTLDRAVSQALSQPRFRTTLLGAFGALGLVLAMVGIYGVLSYSVGQRTHEIGVRMAFGAGPASVLRMVIGEGMALTTAGIIIGVGGALGLTRFMRSLLFEIAPSDPATFVVVASVLALVALAACYIPARRAMKVDPMAALRYE